MKVFEKYGDELHIESSEKGLYVDISWGDGSFGGYDDWYSQFEVKDAEAFVRKFSSVGKGQKMITMDSEGGSWNFTVGVDEDGYWAECGDPDGTAAEIEGLSKEDFNNIARGLVQAIKDCKAKQAKN